MFDNRYPRKTRPSYPTVRAHFLVHVEDLHDEKRTPRAYVRERGSPMGEYVCEATTIEWARRIAQGLEMQRHLMRDEDPEPVVLHEQPDLPLGESNP